MQDEASFVVFGSLARKEFTSGSDLDCCLIIDGRADPGHRDLERIMVRTIRDSKFSSPAAAGAFGSMVFSHELVHFIGGQTDTNANLTRRQLLLLESEETAPRMELSPRSRLIRSVLRRYFEEETDFPGKHFFPRFFLNDVVRYWRTIAVDYAAKNRERGAQGWALRNAKLRFSRKLLYIAGMLLTYETSLFPVSDLIPGGEDGGFLSQDQSDAQLSNIERCFYALRLTPLELLARACINLSVPMDISTDLFQSYCGFLDILGSPQKRKKLESLTFDDAVTEPIFEEIRDLSHTFQGALNQLFISPQNPIGELTLKYGLF